MAWVALLAFVALGGIVVSTTQGDHPGRIGIATATVIVGLGLIVRLLVLALAQEEAD